MSTAARVRTGEEVVNALLTADTSAKKSQATKLQKEYVAQRVAQGMNAKKVAAGLLSRVSRLQNEKSTSKSKTAAAPKKATKTTVKAKPKAKAAPKTK